MLEIISGTLVTMLQSEILQFLLVQSIHFCAVLLSLATMSGQHTTLVHHILLGFPATGNIFTMPLLLQADWLYKITR